jgi:hypothetical protein
LNHAIFAPEEVIFLGLECRLDKGLLFEDRNVVAVMFTMSGRVSGDHPPLVSPPLQVGWDTALSAEKYPVFT